VCPEAPNVLPAAEPAVKAGDGPLGSKTNHLASHLQASIEVERSQLTRQLHDDLGGLLVGALMDVAWVEARLQAPDLQAKLGRARDSLRAAVDLKRNLIEGMRPTLLENVGVFAAMRWHFAKYCEIADLTCSANFPAAEPAVRPHVAIGIYRITEEALRLISGPLKARSITLSAHIEGSNLGLQFLHDGSAVSYEQISDLAEFKSMAQRISTLHGKFTDAPTMEGGLQWQITVPLEHGVVAS
jgi:signal transduction histidine kinase